MHKQIYLLALFFTLLSPAITSKSHYYLPTYDPRCLRDPFDTHFFPKAHKIAHNVTFSPPNDNTSTTETLPNTPNGPILTEPQDISPKPSENFAKKLANGIGSFFKRIPEAVTESAKQVEEKVKGVTQTIADTTKSAGSKVKSNIMDGLHNIKEKTVDISNKISEKVHNGWDTIKGSPKAVIEEASPIGEKVEEAPKQILQEKVSFGEKVKSFTKKAADSVKEAGNKVKGFVVEKVTGSVSTIKEKAENIEHKISDTVKEGWDKVKEVPEAVVRTASSVSEKAKNVVSHNIVDKARKIQNTVSEGTYKLFDGFKKIPSKAAEKVSLVKEKCKELIPSRVSEPIKSFGVGVKDFFVSLPQKGGVVIDKLKTAKNYLGEKKNKLMEKFSENKDKLVTKAKEGVKSVIERSGGILSLGWSGFGWLFSSVKDTLVYLVTGAAVILGFYVFIQIRPFLMFILDILSLCRCRSRRSERPVRAQESSHNEPAQSRGSENIGSNGEKAKLKKEDFVIECVSLRADKIAHDDKSNFLRFHLHYEIKDFPTLEGDVFLKFTTLCSGTVRQHAVFTVPAEEFVCRSVWSGCSFQDPLSKYTEDADVRLCVDFKSDNGQYFSISSKDFKIMLV